LLAKFKIGDVKMSKAGKLFYNKDNDRMDIVFNNGNTYGGLHCGTCLDVKIKGKYVQTRIEMGREWGLVGTGLIGIDNLNGLSVRM